METVTLSSKGQLVIPKQVRQLANLQAGDAFQVRFLDGEIRLRPVSQNRVSTLDEVAGCLASSVAKNATPLSDDQVHAAIKARLKAEDAATMSRPAAKPQKTSLKKAP